MAGHFWVGRPVGRRWHRPAVTTQIVDQHTLVTTRLIDSVERARLGEMLTAVYPKFAHYQSKTGRVIPLFILTPQQNPSF